MAGAYDDHIVVDSHEDKLREQATQRLGAQTRRGEQSTGFRSIRCLADLPEQAEQRLASLRSERFEASELRGLQVADVASNRECRLDLGQGSPGSVEELRYSRVPFRLVPSAMFSGDACNTLASVGPPAPSARRPETDWRPSRTRLPVAVRVAKL